MRTCILPFDGRLVLFVNKLPQLTENYKGVNRLLKMQETNRIQTLWLLLQVSMCIFQLWSVAQGMLRIMCRPTDVTK